MAGRVNRVTVDPAGYPDLVAIYLGMRVNSPRGLKTVLQFGPRISSAVAEKPEGLLLHESLFFSLFPLHVGMRQYWQDFDALEARARSMPQRKWSQDFVRDSGGTFWHETYFLRGGMEAIYDDVPKPVGLMQFAPTRSARGAMFSARRRAGLPGESRLEPPMKEDV